MRQNRYIASISVFFITSFFQCFAFISEPIPLIIDQDGGVDDIIALQMQLLANPERISAVTVLPADSYAKPASWVSLQVINTFFPHNTIRLGTSSFVGTNPFPKEWRNESWMLTGISVWSNPKDLEKFSVSSLEYAPKLIERILESSKTKVDILETGPFTHIAKALHHSPQLSHKINRIYAMGGAFHVKGNVDAHGHDGTAEWNIYNNPPAFLHVLEKHIPITLVPLDATQAVPVRLDFLKKLSTDYPQQKKSLKVFLESFELIKPVLDKGLIYFWDTLTSVAVINPQVIKTKTMKVNVKTHGPASGKTFECGEGYPIEVALSADQTAFENTLIELLMKSN